MDLNSLTYSTVTHGVKDMYIVVTCSFAFNLVDGLRKTMYIVSRVPTENDSSSLNNVNNKSIK